MENSNQNIKKVRVHDAIVGTLYLVSALLAFYVNLNWIFVVMAVGVLQIISPITKFCPVYFVLNKMMPNSDPIQHGK